MGLWGESVLLTTTSRRSRVRDLGRLSHPPIYIAFTELLWWVGLRPPKDFRISRRISDHQDKPASAGLWGH